MTWRKLRVFVFTVLALSLIPATRYYLFDAPLLQFFRDSRRIDPLTLHLAGEFVESNLGTERNSDGSVTVRMIADQYLFIPHCVAVPAGVPIHLRITSADSVHSLTLTGTQYNVKVSPGSIAQAQIEFAEPGDHKTKCGEFCGSGHYAMRSEWTVLPHDQFAALPGGRVNCAAQ